VYLDANDNGRQDAGELVAEMPRQDLTEVPLKPFGYYVLKGLPAGTYTFRAVKPADQAFTTSASFRVSVKTDEFTAGAEIGVVWPY
jgi:hypothetical protein